MKQDQLKELLDEMFSQEQSPSTSAEETVDLGGRVSRDEGGGTEERLGEWEQGPIRIEVVAEDRVNFAMERNGIQIIRRMTVKNVGDKVLEMVEINLQIDAGNLEKDEFADPKTERLQRIEPGKEFVFNSVPLRLRLQAMVTLEEETPARLNITAIVDGKVQGAHVHEMVLLAFNQWNATHPAKQILAAHVQPNHPAVKEVLQRAGALIEKQTGSSSLEGYQAGPERVVQIAKAIYDTLGSHDIKYINPPAGWETTGQKVRSPDQVIDDHQGTCIDLACVYASCLEQAGLHPVVYVIAGHAYAGVFLEERSLKVPITDEVNLVLNLQDEELLLPVETVSFTEGDSFDEALRLGRSHLYDPSCFNYLLDVHSARVTERITPLPDRRRNEQGVLVAGDSQIVIEAPRSRSSEGADGEGGVRFRTQQELPARIKKWQRELLDLTLRNPLLNFKPKKSSLSLLLPKGTLADLEDYLARGTQLALMPQDELASIHDQVGARAASEILEKDQDQVRYLLASSSVPTAHDTAQTLKRSKALFRKGRTLEEETGTNSLYLVLGVVSWKEGAKEVTSPLILIPARLSKPSTKRATTLYADEGAEAAINFCLVHKLRDAFDLDLSEFEKMKLDEHGIDVDWVLSTIRRKLRESNLPFRVDETAHLAVLSFGKYQLWHDLEHRSHALMDNPVVRHLVETPHLPYEDPCGQATEDKCGLEEAEAFCPLPCDSSQLNAVIEAGKGRSFVLQGPPGTGKSQTITNLIAHCLANGKKVLFVAEKAAALHVVKERLDSVGLGASCLELHSKSTSLPVVREQFAASFVLGEGQDPQGWVRDLKSHKESQKRLADYVEAIHEPMPIGLSPYRAQETRAKLGEGAAAVVPSEFLQLGGDVAAEVDSALGQAAGAGIDADVSEGHSWSLARLIDLDGFDEEAWRGWSSEMMGLLNTPLFEGVRGLDRLEASCDLQFLEKLIVLLGIDGQGLLPGRSFSDGLNQPSWREAVVDALSRLDELAEVTRKVERGYELEAVEDEDSAELLKQATHASTSFPVLKWFRFRPVIARMQACAHEGYKVRASSVRKDIVSVRKLLKLRIQVEALISAVPSPSFPFGDVLGRPELIPRARERYEAALKVTDLITGRALEAEAVREFLEHPLGKDAVKLSDALSRVLELFIFMGEALKSDEASQRSWQSGRGLLGAIKESLPDWGAAVAVNSLRRWTTFWAHLEKVSQLGLQDFVHEIAGGKIALGDLRKSFMRGLSAQLVEESMRQRPALRGFDDKAHTRELDRFKGLDKKISEGYRQIVPKRLYEGRPKGAQGDGSHGLGEVGLLRRWVDRKRGGDSVRKVLEQWPAAVSILKPCFLMSPSSVAQYLSVDGEGEGMHFDVVIFDEASQIPVPDAIGAVARGDSLVVVGDTKQMPPTAFFKAAEEEDVELDEGLLVVDAESILSECHQANIPSLWLDWHYRSKHESLIAFSNAHYYEGKLTSFPSPYKTTDRLGVSFREVEGGYFDTGKTRTNPPEAQQIVREIVRICGDPSDRGRSIGVVTFNQQQQELVQDLIEKEEADNPALKAAVDGEGVEPLFVKNLENVQGDERDIILFSICYGPSKEGKPPSMNFGPLNRAGGERRLNVAVTRAREKVQVFSTLLPEMIDLRRTNAVGAAHLKAFLEMAQKGGSGEVSSQAAEGCDTDAHRAEIAEALRGRGLTVREQLGMSNFKIDLAVGIEGDEETFKAAVLLDGPGYSKLATTRDRDSIPPLMLEALDWNIYRVWLPAWIQESERLLDEIEELARHGAPEVEAPAEEAAEVSEDLSVTRQEAGELESDNSKLDSITTALSTPLPSSGPDEVEGCLGGSPFTPYEGGRNLGSKEQFDSPSGRAAIVRGIKEVVKTEGPVQGGRLGLLVARRFGFKRVQRTRVEAVLKYVPAGAVRGGRFGAFIWPEGVAPEEWKDFRHSIGRGVRTVEEIAPEELRNAMLQATRDHLGLSRDELIKLIAQTFGLGNLGKKIRSRLDSVLDWVLAEGVLEERGDVIVAGPLSSS